MAKLKLFLLSLAAGSLMTIFVLMNTGVFRHFFSLGAVLIGIYVFKSYEGKWSRISFILLTVIFAFLFPPIYVVLAYTYGWPVDPQFLDGIDEAVQ